MKTVQVVVIHTCNHSAWKSALNTWFWWSAVCWQVLLCQQVYYRIDLQWNDLNQVIPTNIFKGIAEITSLKSLGRCVATPSWRAAAHCAKHCWRQAEMLLREQPRCLMKGIMEFHQWRKVFSLRGLVFMLLPRCPWRIYFSSARIFCNQKPSYWPVTSRLYSLLRCSEYFSPSLWLLSFLFSLSSRVPLLLSILRDMLTGCVKPSTQYVFCLMEGGDVRSGFFFFY